MTEQAKPGVKADGRGRHKALKVVVVVVAIVAVVTAGRAFDLQTHIHKLLQQIASLGPTGYLVFSAVYVLACVLLIPGSILTLGAGAIYGVIGGSILTSLSSTVGATAAFLAGRYLARDWVVRKTAGSPTFTAIDHAVGREGWKIVGLTRLSPVFPFALLNYAYGLTRVNLRHYVLASWIGMLPGTVMYVYLGSLAKSLSAVGVDCTECERSTLEWVMYGVGLLATIAVTVVVTRIARRALKARMPAGEPA